MAQREKFDLEERTAILGESVIRFCLKFPRTAISSPLISQLIRSATSIGANYCEADEASSRREFTYRIHVCKKEAREAKYWLRMIVTAIPAAADEARILWKEVDELNRIFASIARRSKTNEPKTDDKT